MFRRHIVSMSCVILLLLVGTVELSAKTLPTAKPQRVGLSGERLERLSAQMQQAVDDGVMVGGLGMVARRGKVVYAETWGQSDREAGKAMTMDTIFRIYSMSKPITSVAVMMLYEEGRFFLNDPVANYIPELANLQVAVATAGGDLAGEGNASAQGVTRKPLRQPTIRNLLNHTAGFTYGIFGNTEVDQQYRTLGILNHPDLQDFVAKLGQVPLQYDPGTRWHYSVAVDVQGRLVEAISGMRFGEFLQQRIFEPLGMTDTSFIVPAAKQDRLAQIYSPEGTASDIGSAFLTANTSTELVVSPDEINASYREGATFESGGGGLVSTASDYMRFAQMMLNGGELDGVRLLSPKTVELMTMNHLGKIQMGFGRTGVGFGLGFAVALDQGEIGELGSAGEYNWGGAAGTSFWIDPTEQLIGVFMVQSIPHRTTLSNQFKVLTYQALVD